MASEWVHGSGQSGKPRPPARKKKMKCPECNQEVIVYSDKSIEKHKVYTYKDGKKTSAWKYCSRKKL